MLAAQLERRPSHLFLVHSFGGATARLGRAAEGRIVATGPTGMPELGDVALGMPNDCQLGIATLARVRADNFRGLAALLQDLRTFHPLFHAGDPHGFALDAHHRNTVVRFERIHFLFGVDSLQQHHLMLATFHRLHRLGIVGGAGSCRQPGCKRQRDYHAGTKEVLLVHCLHVIAFYFVFCRLF